jgi:hypothetical protein
LISTDDLFSHPAIGPGAIGQRWLRSAYSSARFADAVLHAQFSAVIAIEQPRGVDQRPTAPDLL